MGTTLTFASVMAGNADPFYQALAQYLGVATHNPWKVVDSLSWDERLAQIQRGAVDLAAVCGAVYTRSTVADGQKLQLLVAPLMHHDRYDNKPVYFADLVVRSDAPFRSFADLQHTVWVYNEQASFSGYTMMQTYLAAAGLQEDYFGRVYASGSHLRSLAAVLAGEADVTAIDSIVLEQALAHEPELADRLRTLHSLGPYPAPPLVLARPQPAKRVASLQQALFTMHKETQGQRVLALAGVKQYVAVSDSDYEPIRLCLSKPSTLNSDTP